MLNNFISGLVSIFYWGKIGSKSLEKILNASRLRTFLYGFMTVVVFVFFYKTYQTATIVNMVQITGIRQGCDSSNNVVDTIQNFYIVHKLANNSMQQVNLDQNVISKYSNFQDINDILNYDGGVYFEIDCLTHPYKFKTNRFIKEKQEKFDAYMDSKNIPHERICHFYQSTYLATNIPSIIPFYPEFYLEKDYYYKDDNIFFREYAGNTRNNPRITNISEVNDIVLFPKDIIERSANHPDFLNNGILFTESFGSIDVEKVDSNYVKMGFFASCNQINDLNIFTAADISQYTYVLNLYSDCPIRDLNILYDIPIEIPQYDEHVKVGVRGIYLDSISVQKLRALKGMGFQVKIPSLANLQLIRSLVLTTLLTALFSLFCRNLYLLIRKWSYKRRKKNWIPISKVREFSPSTRYYIKKGVRNYRIALYAMLLFFIAIIIAWFIIIINNSSVLLSVSIYNYIDYLPLIILPIVALVINYAYKRNVRKRVNIALSGQFKEDSKETNDSYFIFVHERDEEEELNKLIEDQIKESESQNNINDQTEDSL